MGVHTNSNCGCGGTGSGGGTTPEQPGNEFLQNNIGRKLNAGIITIAPVANNNLYDAAVATKVAEYFNTVVLTITEIQTPVIVDVIVFTSGSLRSKKHKLFFSKGKGKYGSGGTTILPGDFDLFYTQNLLIGDITDGNAYATFIDLGNLPDGDYLSAANSAERDFIDEGQTYFITYNKDGKAYLLKFNGEPGYYGGSYPDSFILENFLPASDSDVQPEITRTDQLENTGANGIDRYATITEVNGMNISVNQATAELFLKNADGTNLATINLAFLNNEGTTFYFNDVTQNLELKNDDGDVLSVVPASSFVTGLIRYAGFNGATPHNLEFKDPSNNVVASVPVGMVNVQGLVAALNTKANADGSNAVPFSNWNINAASSFTAEMFGDAYGNFLNDGVAITHAVGYDSAGNRVRRYTSSSFKLWLAIAIADVSGLVSQLNSKVNLNGNNVTQGSNWNINITGSSAAWNSLQRSAGNIADPPFFLTMNSTENNAGATTKAQAITALGINLKANDADVLHKTGNETKSGNLTVTGTMQCYLYNGNSTGNYLVFNSATSPNELSSNTRNAGVSAWRITDLRNSGTDNIIDFVKGTNIVTSIKSNGTIKATGAVNTDEVIIKSQLDSSLATAANNVAGNYVPSSGVSTIAGTKTFSESPVVPAGTLASHAVNVGQVDQVILAVKRPYKVYTALIRQTGTSAPTVTVLENTIGGSPSWAYVDIGNYTLTIPGAFPDSEKVACIISPFWNSISTNNQQYRARPGGDNNTISVQTTLGNSATNGMFSSGSVIEIRVYN